MKDGQIAIASNDNIECMQKEVFLPQIESHPLFDLSFPMRLKKDQLVEVLVHMAGIGEEHRLNQKVNNAAALFRDRGLNVMVLIILSEHPTEPIDGLHMVVTDKDHGKLFTPTFPGLYRALVFHAGKK